MKGNKNRNKKELYKETKDNEIKKGNPVSVK